LEQQGGRVHAGSGLVDDHLQAVAVLLDHLLRCAQFDLLLNVALLLQAAHLFA
jgi:hypothetical protein